ncbi:MAG: MFS transporter [Planctomycetia bacterium]|nr:MFS transporter [Planctomycetia bacterium]
MLSIEHETSSTASTRRARSCLRVLLYVICGLTDFAAFVVVFAASRSLAERHAEPWYLGLVGAAYSLAAGMGSLAGGWLASRRSAPAVFLAGAVAIVASVGACWRVDPDSVWFLPGYCLLGVGLGFLYPPLIGWLNQGDDVHSNQNAVSRRLILFCVAWNAGMMCGQLAGGTLYRHGARATLGTAFVVALANLAFSIVAAIWVRQLPAVLPEMMEPPREATALASRYQRLSWIANLGGVFGASMVFHLLPDVIVNLGISSDAHGRLLAVWRAIIIAMYLLMHVSSFWHYRLNVSLASQALGAVGMSVIALAQSTEMLLVGLALLGQLVGFNYFSGLYYSTAGSSHETRALAAGIHEATLAAGMSFGMVAGGLFGSLFGHRFPYQLAASVIAVLIAVQLAAWRTWLAPRSRQA